MNRGAGGYAPSPPHGPFFISGIFKFWFQVLNVRSRFSGGGQSLTQNLWDRILTYYLWRVRWTSFIGIVCFTGLYRLLEYWSDNSSNTETRKNQNYTQIDENVEKTRKSSEWRHIHRVELSKKSAAQKYQVLIFRTNEGDFGGTPVKNQ